MSKIEIIAYAVISDNNHETIHLENNFVDSLDDVKEFKKQKTEFYKEKYKTTKCIVHPVTKQYEEN